MSLEEKEEKPEEEKIIVRMIYAAKVDRIEGTTITLLIRDKPTDRYEPVDYEIHEDFDKSLKETTVYVGRELVDVRLVNDKIQDMWSH